MVKFFAPLLFFSFLICNFFFNAPMLLFIVLMATDPNPSETLLIVEPKMPTEETESNDLALSMKRCYLHQFLKFNKFRNFSKVTDYNNGKVDDNLLSCDLTALLKQRLKFMEWYLGSIGDQFSFTEEFTEVSDKILQLITDFPKTVNATLISSDGEAVETKTRDDFFAEAFDIYLTHMIVAEMDAALRLKLTNSVCKIIVENQKTVSNDTVLGMRIEYKKIAENFLTAYEKASKNMIFAYKKIAEDTSTTTTYERLLGDVNAAHKETDKDMCAAYEKAIENISAAQKTLVKRKKATNKIKGLKEVEACKKIVDDVDAAYRKVTEDMFAEYTKSAALVETWNKLLVNMYHDSSYSKNIKLKSAGKTIMTGLKCKTLVERASFMDFYTDLKIYYSKAANKSKKAVIQKPTVIIIDFTKALIQHLLQCNKETDEKEIALLRKAFIKNTLKFLTTNADGDYLRCFTPDIVEKMRIVAFPIAQNDIRSMLIFAGIDKSHLENCFKESYVLTTILHKYANSLTWLIKSALRNKGRIMCKFALTDHKSSSEEEIGEEETGEEEIDEEETGEEETGEEETGEEETGEEEIDEEDNKPHFRNCFENGEIAPWILQKFTQTTNLVSKDEETTDKRIGSKRVNPNNKSRPDNALSGIEYQTDARKKLICRNSDKSDKKLPTSKEKKVAETNIIEITKIVTCSIANRKYSLELYYSIVISPDMIDSFIYSEIKGISFFSLTAQSDPRVEMIYGLYAIADHTQDLEIEPRNQKATYNPIKMSDDGHRTKNKVKKVRF